MHFLRFRPRIRFIHLYVKGLPKTKRCNLVAVTVSIRFRCVCETALALRFRQRAVSHIHPIRTDTELKRKPKIVSEYDQEIPQSQTADNPVAPRGRATQPSRDTRKTN